MPYPSPFERNRLKLQIVFIVLFFIAICLVLNLGRWMFQLVRT
jgi:hypothetical protein